MTSATVPTAVRLTRKFAEAIDGVDLSRSRVGDRLELPARDAQLLIAEGWAELCAPREQAADRKPRSTGAGRRATPGPTRGRADS